MERFREESARFVTRFDARICCSTTAVFDIITKHPDSQIIPYQSQDHSKSTEDDTDAPYAYGVVAPLAGCVAGEIGAVILPRSICRAPSLIAFC